jgi:superfamily II DNA or RNA helicase
VTKTKSPAREPPDLLADDVAEVLAGSDGATVAELAGCLSVDGFEVSRSLFASHGRFRCDRGVPPRWWLSTSPGGQSPTPAATGAGATDLPSSSLGLYPWQADALNAWERRGGRGVVEAVTGAGKTRVGVAAALDELGRRGQVLVVVPTVELQHQWVAELETRLGPGSLIGRMGAGAGDHLATHDVVVAVVNSARALDLRPIRRGGLLVADECHRYGSAMNHLALDPRFTRRLGLSATYAREDDGNVAWLDPYFGGTCFRLGYARAVGDGVTARFNVTLVGVRFSPIEQCRYDELTELMKGLRARLLRQFDLPDEPFEAFLQAVVALAESGGEGSGLARAYRQAMLERRRLLADTPAKDAALVALAPAVAEAERAMVFTQSIAVSERAGAVLAGCGLAAGVIHSQMSRDDRREALRLFGSGEITVLAAPRLLDEGIDVPAADLAVIVGASRSRRQMIQRMGRVLRRKPAGRCARFAVVFVEGTVEDPRRGAHEVFLEEIVGVADRVSTFTSDDVCDRPELVLGALRRTATEADHPIRL